MKLLKRLLKLSLCVSGICFLLWLPMFLRMVEMYDVISKVMLGALVVGYVLYLCVVIHNLYVAFKHNSLSQIYRAKPWYKFLVFGASVALWMLCMRVINGAINIESMMFAVMTSLIPFAAWPIYRYEHTEVIGELE